MPNLKVGLLFKFRNVSYLLGHPASHQKQLSFLFIFISAKFSQGRGIRGLLVYSKCMSRGMGFPTMWYVRPAEPQISLRIRAV